MKKLISLILVAVMLLSVMPMAYAEGNNYKTGDIIQFGSYPQSEVEDEILINELNALAPEWDEWVSYEYYSGTGDYGTMVQGDWMRYIDIIHGGKKYRGVKFTEYRPECVWELPPSLTYSIQNANGYNINAIYWFEFEALKWRVLDSISGLVMCETIIDSQSFNNTIYRNGFGVYDCFNDFYYTNYACDYEKSSIRKWLNNNFYNTAFTDNEKKEITTTTINNDGVLTSLGTSGYEKLDSKETKDKIFLMSYNEVRNGKYGFSSDSYDYDGARRAKSSDYAQSQGLYVYRDSNKINNGNSCWLLRSPGNYSLSSCIVDTLGTSHQSCDVGITYGVRPALRFNDISKIVFDESETPYIPEDNNGNEKNCSHICHNVGLVAVIWKILRFFYKIFGINSICACGEAHY